LLRNATVQTPADRAVLKSGVRHPIMGRQQKTRHLRLVWGW
jgi:hypothetical protein